METKARAEMPGIDRPMGKALKRRGILAAAGAAVAILVAKQTSQPVAASTPLLIANTESGGTVNGVTGPTMIYDNNVSYTSQEAVLVASCKNGSGLAGLRGTTGPIPPTATPVDRCGVYGDALSEVGVLGISGTGTGVFGSIGAHNISLFANVGVGGQNDNGFGIGVQGTSSSYYGVQGLTSSGIAVRGNVRTGGTGTSNIGVLGAVGADPSFPSSQPNTIGVYGQNLSTGTNGAGVLGQSDLLGSTGVKGISAKGFPIIGNVTGTGSTTNTAAGVLGAGTKGPGMQGQSTSGHGLVGTTSATDGHAGLIGNATNAGGVGLIGIAPGYGTQTVGHAGEFYGNVKIFGGALLAPAMQAVVPHAGDNSYRLLHTVASPDAWFEDAGEGTLASDTAEIALDADFAALIHTDTYQVFLTPHSPLHLHVATRTAGGFTVVATPSGTTGAGSVKRATGGGTFSWRVMAKRKDIVGERLAKVAAPTAPKVPAAFTIPETPEVKPPTKQP